MYEVVIKGFRSLAECQAFYEWYEGQGEQDACNWFEGAEYAQRVGLESATVDLYAPVVMEGTSLAFTIRARGESK